MKYLRVADGARSNAGGFTYKIDELNIADNWNPAASTPKEMGGFNFSQEDKLLRWIHRGDTLYDVIIPEGAEVIEINHKSSPSGVFRCNQIIITNPRALTKEMILDLYKKSTLPEKTYYQCFVTLLFRHYIDIVKYMIDDRINTNNVDDAIREFDDFIEKDESGDIKTFTHEQFLEDVEEIRNYLQKIKEKK